MSGFTVFLFCIVVTLTFFVAAFLVAMLLWGIVCFVIMIIETIYLSVSDFLEERKEKKNKKQVTKK